MTERIVQKIEEIRSLPEHIRLQYAFGAVAVCMIFVIGVWLLTRRQGFLGMSGEVDSGKDQAEATISNVRESFPSTDSLRTLQEQSESLRVNPSNTNADQFVDDELQKSTTPNPNIPNQTP